MKWCRSFVFLICAGLFTPAAWGGANPAPARPALVVLELGEAKALKLENVNAPAVLYPLTVENRGSAGAKKVEVHVNSFVSAGGDSVSPALSLHNPPLPGAAPESSVTFDVPAGQSVPLYLRAELPKAATYRAVVRFVSGKEILLNFPVEIVRTRTQQAVEIGDLPAVQATAALLHRPVSQRFEATAYSTGGSALLLPPVLHSATRKLKNDSPAGVATTLKLAADRQVTVEEGVPRNIPFEVLNLEGPGRYDATIRFPAAGYHPIEKTVTVYVRDPFWMAVAWIALGALVSLGVHAYTAKIRPRLAAQQRVSAMFADLNALQTRTVEDSVSRELVQRVSDNLANQWDGLRRKRSAPTAEAFDLFDQIVQNLRPWIELRRQLLAIRPVSIRDQLMPTLLGASDAFIHADPVATEVQAAVKTLEELPGDINDALVKALRDQVQQFETELSRDSRPQAQEIVEKLSNVRKQLEQNDMKTVLAALDVVRGDYVRLLAADFKDRIATAANPPGGVAPEEWKKLAASAGKALADLGKIHDAEEKTQVFRAVLQSYLTTVLKGLGRLSTGVPENDRPAIQEKLVNVKAVIEAGNLAAAWRTLDDLEKEISSKLVPSTMGAPETAANVLKAAVGPSAAAGALDLIDIVDAAPPSDVLRRSGAAAAAERRIGASDVLLTLIVILVAAAIGLQTLWADNPTWGGWLSYLAAFVWGFALDQFTHAGLLALRPAR